jgi:hypothetical protein
MVRRAAVAAALISVAATLVAVRRLTTRGGSGNQALSSPVIVDGQPFAVFSSIAPTGDLTLVLREVI